MTWARRFKRVFNIDIEICLECGGAVEVIADIDHPLVINKIPDRLKGKAETKEPEPLPESRAPPADLQSGLFG